MDFLLTIRRLFLVFPLLVLFLFPFFAWLADPTLRDDRTHSLPGVPTKTGWSPPPLTYAGWSTGTFQRQFEIFFEKVCPGRKLLLRLFNQIDYSLFKSSYMLGRTMIIGRDNQLDELPFIRDVIQQPGSSEFTIPELMSKLLKIQAELRHRGKIMLVVTTPTKSITYPEFIPSRFHGSDRRAPVLHSQVIDQLNQSQIPYVDGTGIIQQLAATSGHRFFSQGALHWNRYAAAQVATPLLSSISKLTGKPLPLPARIETSSMPARASNEEADTDLVDLLNVLWPPLDYEVTHAVVIYGEKPSGDPPKIAMAGGSFCTALRQVLAQAPTDEIPPIPYAKYGVEFYRDANGDHLISRQAFGNLLALSDILVFELNEYAVISTANKMDEIVAELGSPDSLFPLNTDVSFSQSGLGGNYIESGFSRSEEKACWSDDTRASLCLQLSSNPSSYELTAQVTPFLPAESSRQRIDIKVDGKLIGHDELHDNRVHVLRAKFSAAGPVEIVFSLPDAVSPRSVGRGDDDRKLGLAFFSMRLSPVSSAP